MFEEFEGFRWVLSIARFERALERCGGDANRFWEVMDRCHNGESAAAARLVEILEANGDDYGEVLTCAFDWGEDFALWAGAKDALRAERARK